MIVVDQFNSKLVSLQIIDFINNNPLMCSAHEQALKLSTGDFNREDIFFKS
jgi:hypothetical protein